MINAVDLKSLRADYQQHQPTTFVGDFELSTTEITWLLTDDFALLCGVIADQSIPAKRAWQLPGNLQQRLGAEQFTPEWFATHETALAAAIKMKPALHRFPSTMARNLASLGATITTQYQGQATALLTVPSYQELVARLQPITGIGIKKINALLLILLLDKRQTITGLEASQALFDVHLSRIITGLTGRSTTAATATTFCQQLDATCPARVSPYLWRLDRQHKTLQDVIRQQTKEAPQ
ncbi:hypothetical protein [Furfurilactobacillus siliginis]|uniref:HhH-GPD domain-containing protein n=1 Tax=Furfurilactobacillus siliginis TaxID=348151 RepID=A0A0R2L2I5_9LACO|nr:hypothetical protein [Furfurilactobacillus siliginis]KRN96015.1 hypothetical protein IV55_GL001693 [Furfurilactobacillus siliginis]GEK28830.1 hypothetical protein LSI01_11410 [Furfurilactobacillus siliginis]